MTDIALQNALTAIDDAFSPNCDESQRLIQAKCRGLMRGYHERWQHVNFDVLAVEQLVTHELYNPDTARKSRSFTVAGKLDVICQQHGRRMLIDHKTCSQDITDPNAPYWRQLVIEGQVNHYMLLEWQNGRKVESALWDVLRKPGIAPKKLSKAERASVVATGRYFNQPVTDGDRASLANGEERESFAMYEARLFNDCAIEKPEWYFQRRAVPRLDNELVEYAEELWQHSQDILRVQNSNKLPVRNSGACMLYGSPCNFLGICSGYDTPDSDRWIRKEQVHAELELEGDGRDVLTNSRIRCFQTCQRKHYYQYSLGIERLDEEQKESLWFGTVWHLALESWFRTFIKENVYVNGIESPAIGVGTSASEESELDF